MKQNEPENASSLFDRRINQCGGGRAELVGRIPAVLHHKYHHRLHSPLSPRGGVSPPPSFAKGGRRGNQPGALHVHRKHRSGVLSRRQAARKCAHLWNSTKQAHGGVGYHESPDGRSKATGGWPSVPEGFGAFLLLATCNRDPDTKTPLLSRDRHM